MFTDIKRLIAFATVVEEGSFIRAADRLNTSQPWLSVQLRQLEEMVDLPLLERSRGKRVTPTVEGRELYSIAKRAMGYCEDISKEIKSLGSEEGGMLTLGVDPTSIYVSSRNDLIFRFMSRFSKVKASIESLPPPELMRGLLSREFDLIIITTPEPRTGIEVLPLYSAELRLIAPKDTVPVDADGAADITGMKLITFPESYDPHLFGWLHERLSPIGVSFVECPEKNLEALLRYALMADCPTIAVDFSDQIVDMRDRMEVLPIKGLSLSVEWSLVRRTGTGSKPAQNFWDLAAAV